MELKHPSALVSLLALLGACAAAQPRVARYGTSAAYEEEEARAIEAAKHHPIALPRERPQYPEQTPPALAQREPAPPPPPPPSAAAEGASAPSLPPPGDAPPAPSASAERIVAPNPPPPYTADEPSYAAPGLGYTWAPGYWAWGADRYSWVGGDWLAPRPGFVYVGPSWSQTGYGWEFSVGGWARAGTSFVVFPVYRHPFRPYLHTYSPYASRGFSSYGPGLYNARRWGSTRSYGDSWGTGRGLSYHDTYSAPRAYSAPSYEGRRDRQEVRVGPTYRAREAYSAPVTHAPRSELRSAPNASPHVTQGIRVGGGGGGGGGRSSSSRATVRTR